MQLMLLALHFFCDSSLNRDWARPCGLAKPVEAPELIKLLKPGAGASYVCVTDTWSGPQIEMGQFQGKCSKRFHLNDKEESF